MTPYGQRLPSACQLTPGGRGFVCLCLHCRRTLENPVSHLVLAFLIQHCQPAVGSQDIFLSAFPSQLLRVRLRRRNTLETVAKEIDTFPTKRKESRSCHPNIGSSSLLGHGHIREQRNRSSNVFQHSLSCRLIYYRRHRGRRRTISHRDYSSPPTRARSTLLRVPCVLV